MVKTAGDPSVDSCLPSLELRLFLQIWEHSAREPFRFPGCAWHSHACSWHTLVKLPSFHKMLPELHTPTHFSHGSARKLLFQSVTRSRFVIMTKTEIFRSRYCHFGCDRCESSHDHRSFPATYAGHEYVVCASHQTRQ